MERENQQLMNTLNRSCNNSMLSENEQGAHPKQQLRPAREPQGRAMNRGITLQRDERGKKGINRCWVSLIFFFCYLLVAYLTVLKEPHHCHSANTGGSRDEERIIEEMNSG